MPNWCSNSVTVTHSNPEMLERLANANKDALFANFFPVPQELCVEAHLGADDAQLSPEIRAIYEQNLLKHGVRHWYDWCIAHWGTKWDAAECDIMRQDGTVYLSFDTAWGPPIMWYNSMINLGFEIQAYYAEPNMAFCGRFTNDTNDHIEWADVTDVPADILEQFPWILSYCGDLDEDDE